MDGVSSILLKGRGYYTKNIERSVGSSAPNMGKKTEVGRRRQEIYNKHRQAHKCAS